MSKKASEKMNDFLNHLKINSWQVELLKLREHQMKMKLPIEYFITFSRLEVLRTLFSQSGLFQE